MVFIQILLQAMGFTLMMYAPQPANNSHDMDMQCEGGEKDTDPNNVCGCLGSNFSKCSLSR